MEAGWSIRKAGVEDLEDLVRLRLELLRSSRGVERFENDETLVELTRQYFARAIPAGRFHAWVAEAGGRLVASGGVMPFERPPLPGNMAGLEMHILGMYTEPGWRGRGIARALFSELMRFAREQGAGRIWLHATAEGRPLYESAGFQPNPTALEWTPRGNESGPPPDIPIPLSPAPGRVEGERRGLGRSLVGCRDASDLCFITGPRARAHGVPLRWSERWRKIRVGRTSAS